MRGTRQVFIAHGTLAVLAVSDNVAAQHLTFLDNADHAKSWKGRIAYLELRTALAIRVLHRPLTSLRDGFASVSKHIRDVEESQKSSATAFHGAQPVFWMSLAISWLLKIPCISSSRSTAHKDTNMSLSAIAGARILPSAN
jgi:hypothetical protein